MSDRDYTPEDLAQSGAARYAAVRQQTALGNAIAMLKTAIETLRNEQMDDEIGTIQDVMSDLEHRIERLDEALAVADMIERPRGAHYRAVA